MITIILFTKIFEIFERKKCIIENLISYIILNDENKKDNIVLNRTISLLLL
jgi:hypothetical protein